MGVGPPAARVAAVEGDGAAGAALGRGHTIRQGLRQGRHDHRRQAVAGGGVHVHRRGKLGVQQVSGGGEGDADGRGAALVLGQVRPDGGLHAVLHHRPHHAGPEVQRTPRLFRRGKLELQLVALDVQRRRDLQRPVQLHAVVVDVIRDRAVGARRHGRDARAELPLGDGDAFLPAGEHVVEAEAVHQRGEPVDAVEVRGHLRANVAPGDLRGAGVGADELLHGVVEHAAFIEFQGRYQQPFLEHLGGVAGVGARHLAADVRLVRGVADKGDDLPLMENRRDERDVAGVVLAVVVGMVQDEGVAVADGAGEVLKDPLELGAHHPQPHRVGRILSDVASPAVADAQGQVLALLHDGGIAVAHELLRQLVRDLVGGVVDDLELDGVHASRTKAGT